MIRVGLADSGVDGPASAKVVARADFLAVHTAGPLQTGPRDPSGHGSALAAVIVAPGEVELLDARIFDASLRTSAAQAAAAIDWLVANGAQIINLSFGLRDDRAVLREACARAVSAGVLLVASVPARGEPVFPASYPDVLRATGDARCSEEEISWLGSDQADAAGTPRTPCGRVAGASAGCAHVCAALLKAMIGARGAGRAELLEDLKREARHRGPERRGA